MERKYDLPVGFVMPDLTAVAGVHAVGEASEQDLKATYYDTPEFRLAAQRITLRRRTGGPDAGWHLKRPAGTNGRTGDRTETHAPLEPDGHAMPRRIQDAVRQCSRDAPLASVATIHTRRMERPLRDRKGRILALVAADDVSSSAPATTTSSNGDGAVVQHWRELEVELVDGNRALLEAVERRLCEAGARPATAPSKLARALADRHPTATTRPTASRPPTISRSDGSGVLRAYIQAQLDAITGNQPGVRAGDPDAVHDMRVATRRLRSTLRTFRPLLDRSRTQPLCAELHWLADLLGRVRDGDVMAARLARAVAAEPPELVLGPVAARTHARLFAETTQARQRLVEALDSDRYQSLLDALDSLADALPTDVPARRLRGLARKSLRRADNRLDAADRCTTPGVGAGIAAERDARLHAARRAYKQARYAVEAIQPISGRPATRLAKRLSTLQETLGTHQDTLVTGRLLRDYGVRAHLDGENAFTYGLLYARQHAAGVRVLDRLARARASAGTHGMRGWIER